MRASLQGYVEHIYGQNQYAGLLLGLLIGDKSLIPTDQYNTFVDSGLVHIIAVSGGNIAMVVILLSFLLKRVPLYVRNGLIMLMIIVYAMICGGDSSVVRAAIMGCLTLLALFWGREVSIWRAMKYAFVGILLLNPFSLVYDVGLLLSFSAIIGIVLFNALLHKEGEGRF
jgi:competence protein ComEC